MKKALLAAALPAALFLGLSLPPSLRADVVTINGVQWTYSIKNGEATVEGIPTSTEGAVSIPQKLGGYDVTSIADGAFANCSSIRRLVIPASVTYIGDNAFGGLESLETVHFLGAPPEHGDPIFEPYYTHRFCDFSRCVHHRETIIGEYSNGHSTYPIKRWSHISERGDSELVNGIWKTISISERRFNHGTFIEGLESVVFPSTLGYRSVREKIQRRRTGYYLPQYARQWRASLDEKKEWCGELRMVGERPNEIRNVRARPVPGTQKVRVFYDLDTRNGDKYDVSLSLGGGNGGVPAATALTGDVGAGVIPGKNKTIEWDAGSDVTDAVLINAIAQVEAMRANETLEGESNEFGVDTRGGWEIENVWCEFCEGAYGTAQGKHATFLEGVPLPVSFFVELKNRQAIKSFLVNGQSVPLPSPGFVMDVGGLRAGGKMEVAAVCLDGNGREITTKPFRVNLDVAPVPEGAGEMFALDTSSGRVLYAGETGATLPIFEDVDDFLFFFGKKIPFKVWPSVSVAKSFDSASGRYRQNNDAGLRRTVKHKRRDLAELFRTKPLARFGSVDIDGELGGGSSMEWLPEKQCWGNAVGSFRVKLSGDAKMSGRIPQTLWIVKVEGGFRIAATLDARIDRNTGLIEGTLDVRPLVSLYGNAMAGASFSHVKGSVGGDIDYAALLGGRLLSPSLSTETFSGTLWGELYWKVFGLGNFKEKDKLRVWWTHDFLSGTSSHGASGNIKGNLDEPSPDAESFVPLCLADASFSARSVPDSSPRIKSAGTVSSTKGTGGSTTPFQTGNGPYPSPAFAAAGEAEVLAFLQDNGSQSDVNRTAVAVQRKSDDG